MIAWIESARAAAPAAMLIAPLLGAIFASILPRGIGWTVSVLLALTAAIAALDLARGGVLSLAPFDLRVDAITAITAPILACAGAACVIGARFLAPSDSGAEAAPSALSLLQLAWFGWMGAAFANDVLAQFGCLTIGWLSLCGLAAFGAERDRAALSAAFRMLIWCGAAGAAFAFGAALVHHATGSFDLAEIASAAGAAERPRILGLGFALMLSGAAALAGIAPLHSWTPALYGRGARLASLAFASVGAIAALTLIARLALAAAIAGAPIERGVSIALATLGALSVAIGSVQAIGARDLRRLMAYAGAAQGGAILIALSLGAAAGHAAAFMHMITVSLIALGVLGGAAIIEGRFPLSHLDGLGRRAPLAGAAMAIGAMGLVGAPLTLGFLSRWRLIEAALAQAWWWAAGVMIAASLAAVFYAGRVIARLYVRRPGDEERAAWRVSLSPAHALAICAAIGFGLNATALWQAASLAGELLQAGGP
ncbi:MAG: proton-conducting transporter membrane subunit [Hyphomonadaceae bacterium]